MRILVGSKSPVKIGAVEEAFSKFYEKVEVIAFDVESNVPIQPIGLQTLDGAVNRATALLKINREQKLCADYFVGLEGGIINDCGNWYSRPYMCVIDRHERIRMGTGSSFLIPESIVPELLSGVELGKITDRITKQENTKQKEAFIGYLTKGMLSRKEYYVHGVIMALVPFLNEELYFR